MRYLASLALAAVLMAGCGSDIESGYVTRKTHEAAHAETRYVSRCGATDPKTGVCKRTESVPQYIPYPEQWRLELMDGDATGYVYVPQVTWDRYNVGDHYPGLH